MIQFWQTRIFFLFLILLLTTLYRKFFSYTFFLFQKVNNKNFLIGFPRFSGLLVGWEYFVGRNGGKKTRRGYSSFFSREKLRAKEHVKARGKREGLYSLHPIYLQPGKFIIVKYIIKENVFDIFSTGRKGTKWLVY